MNSEKKTVVTLACVHLKLILLFQQQFTIETWSSTSPCDVRSHIERRAMQGKLTQTHHAFKGVEIYL